MYHFTLQVIITTPMEMLKIQLQMAGTQTTSRSHVQSSSRLISVVTNSYTLFLREEFKAASVLHLWTLMVE